MEQIIGVNNRIQSENKCQHVFIVGAKSLGAYGGYETFVYKLTEYHQHNKDIQYHIFCKANGDGSGDENELPGVVHTAHNEFEFHNAHCIKINVPQIGPAQAIVYDCLSLSRCCEYIESNQIENPIIYILACRIGPFISHYYRRIHALGGRVYLNPDGHEWMRSKWSLPIRQYWKISERLMVKYADLVICDSVNIERYIHQEYDRKGIAGKDPVTTYIAYGADLTPSTLPDNDPELLSWYRQNSLSPSNYYLVVGRFVPENSYEVMIREFMHSHSERDLVIVTGANDKFKDQLERGLGFSRDPRIKFVGTVYNQELLKKIRENAYAYLHGHTVGGTNPSLIEALGSTNLNLLVNVGFNEEVAGDCALYWSRETGDLAALIDQTDNMKDSRIQEIGHRAKERVAQRYTWEIISGEYAEVFLNE